MLLTITVSHDRDESCNDYTYSRVFEIATANTSDIKGLIQVVMEFWSATYPHKGRIARHPVVDVVLSEVKDESDTLRPVA